MRNAQKFLLKLYSIGLHGAATVILGAHVNRLRQCLNISIETEVGLLVGLFLVTHPRFRRHSAPPKKFIPLKPATATKSSS